jgi:hypothetical protein
MSSDNTYLVVGIIIVSVLIFLTLYAPKKQAELSSSIKNLLSDTVDDLEDIGADAVGLEQDIVDVVETPFSDDSDTDDSDTDDSDTDDSDTDDSDTDDSDTDDSDTDDSDTDDSDTDDSDTDEGTEGTSAPAPAPPQDSDIAPATVMPSPGAQQEAFTGSISGGGPAGQQKTCPGPF